MKVGWFMEGIFLFLMVVIYQALEVAYCGISFENLINQTDSGMGFSANTIIRI